MCAFSLAWPNANNLAEGAFVRYNSCMEATPYISKNIAETHAYAENFLRTLVPNTGGATVVCLSGDLGAGKTAFAKELGGLLGIKKEEITSPTFVIEKIYSITHPHFTHFIHIDAYRLLKGSELLSLGWNEIIADTSNLICIEWPERVEEIIPQFAITLSLKFIDENTREFQMTKNA
jgi:tRNA threonylcarbamoyladenosine biosynthesis protein TsaE